MRSRRRVADAMPALALTDLANAFGLVKFYKAARAARRQADHRLRRLVTHDAERDQPLRAAAARAIARRLPAALRLADARLPQQPAPRPRGVAARVVRRGHRGPDRAVRRARRRRRAGAAAGQRRRRASAPRASGPRCSRTATTSRCSARAAADDDALVAATVALAGASGAAGGRDASGAVPAAATDFRAHEARVCIAEGHVLADPRRPKRFTPDQYFKTQAEMARRSPTCPRRSPTRSRSRSAATSRSRWARTTCPISRRPPGVTLDDHLRAEAAAGLERRLAIAVSRTPASATRRRPEYAARLEFETRTIVQMGFPGYFLIVADFINWAKKQRRAGRARPRLGRGLARRLLAGHHRPRSAALRAAVRALPQSRAGVDARLRHRLLPGRPRPRHRLRQAEVRRRLGVADRDLRHDGGQGGGARRRPRARPALPVRRRHRQADPVPAGQAHHAQGRADDGAAARRAREERGGGARAARARRGARRAHAQRRHARRRRADRARQAHRLLPAVHAARRRRDRLAVRQGRRRGGRPRQVRLPRPHHADDPRLDAALRAPARSRRRHPPGDAAARRQGRLRRLPHAPTRPRCSSSNRAACAS